MAMNKRGMEAGFLVAIIIVIVSFVLISGVVYRWFAKSEDLAAEQLCRNSISFRAANAISVNANSNDYVSTVKAKVNAAPLLCKTIDKKIKGENKEVVMQQLAEKMARCWWMFGEGRYEQILHDSKVLPAIYNLDYEGENKCFLCYIGLVDATEFKDENGVSQVITTQEFLKYLGEHNYSKVKERTYLDYIQSYGGPGALMLLDNINPREAYGISFLAKNKATKDGFFDYFKGGLKTAGGGTLGVVTGGIIGGVGTACVFSGVCVIAVVGGAAGSYMLLEAGLEDLGVEEALYGGAERDVSMVILDDAESAQRQCFSGDLGGK